MPNAKCQMPGVSKNEFSLSRRTPTLTINPRVSFQKSFLQGNSFTTEIFNFGTTNYLTATFNDRVQKILRREIGNSSLMLELSFFGWPYRRLRTSLSDGRILINKVFNRHPVACAAISVWPV
jgi:hypothetical protein